MRMPDSRGCEPAIRNNAFVRYPCTLIVPCAAYAFRECSHFAPRHEMYGHFQGGADRSFFLSRIANIGGVTIEVSSDMATISA